MTLPSLLISLTSVSLMCLFLFLVKDIFIFIIMRMLSVSLLLCAVTALTAAVPAGVIYQTGVQLSRDVVFVPMCH